MLKNDLYIYYVSFLRAIPGLNSSTIMNSAFTTRAPECRVAHRNVSGFESDFSYLLRSTVCEEARSEVSVTRPRGNAGPSDVRCFHALLNGRLFSETHGQPFIRSLVESSIHWVGSRVELWQGRVMAAFSHHRLTSFCLRDHHRDSTNFHTKERKCYWRTHVLTNAARKC